jgi:hypothetical protein
MKKRNAIILLLLAGILAFRCDPEGPDTEQYINLEIPLAIRPQQDTFQLGDTLWLEADFPDSLQDFYSREWIYIGPGFEFFTDIILMKLNNPDGYRDQQEGNGASYTIINYIGEVQTLFSTFGSVRFDYSNGRYRLKTALVPSDIGVNSISFLYYAGSVFGNSVRDDIDLGLDDRGRPIKPFMLWMHYNINGGNTNYYLLTENIVPVCCEEEDFKREREMTFTYYLKK